MKRLLIPCVLLAAIHADMTQAAPSLAGDKITIADDLGNKTVTGTNIIDSTLTTYNAAVTNFSTPYLFNGPDGKPFFSLYLNGTGISVYSMSKPTVGFLDLSFSGLDFNRTITKDVSTNKFVVNYNVLNTSNPLTAVSTNLPSNMVAMTLPKDPRYDFGLRLSLDPNNSFYYHADFNTVADNDAAARAHYLKNMITGNVDSVSGAAGASTVPVPASIWLFGSAISAASLSFRKKQMQVA